MAKKGKASAEVAAKVAEKVSDCKSCGSGLKKMPFDSRHKDFQVLVCDNRACDLYRQFQGKEGEIPEGVNIIFV